MWTLLGWVLPPAPQALSSMPATCRASTKYMCSSRVINVSIYTFFLRKRSVAIFSWNIWVFLLLYIDRNFMEERLWGWKRQIRELEKKECVIVGGGREKSRWSGKRGAVKGCRVKHKMTINHLKIICPKVLAALNSSWLKNYIFLVHLLVKWWFRLGKE